MVFSQFFYQMMQRQRGFVFSTRHARAGEQVGVTFAAGVTPTQCFEMLAAIRQKHPTIPIGLLMYANLVFNRGIDEFYAECARVGVDSVLVADVPVEESAPFRQAAMRHNVAPIFICPPNADDELLRQISGAAVRHRRLAGR